MKKIKKCAEGYILYNCNKTMQECESAVMDFENQSETLFKVLDDFAEKIVIDNAVLLKEEDAVYEMIKIFTPNTRGYNLLKQVAYNQNTNINLNKLITDISDHTLDKNIVYKALSSDMIEYSNLQAEIEL